MIKLIIENTDRFMSTVPKAKRKKYGQFFTNVTTAQYMASLFDFDTTKSQIDLIGCWGWDRNTISSCCPETP